MTTKNYIIHDCDTGSDDMVAIMMLLSQQEIVPAAITCVQGNTQIENVVMNNLRILKLCDMLGKVPVFRGCQKPLVGIEIPNYTHNILGSDGMGGQPNYPPPASSELLNYVQNEHAVDAIVRLSKQHSGMIKIVATGPLTNLAMAVRLDPDLPSRLAGLYIMGGSLTGYGNVTPAAEFNFHYDPEAAFVTLQEFSSRCPTYLIHYEYILKYGLPYSMVDAWLDRGTVKASFAKMALQPLINRSKENGFNVVKIFDAYAMAIAIDPTIASNPCLKKISVELAGFHSRGAVVVDHLNLSSDFFPVTVFDSFDLDKFLQLLVKSVA